MPCEQPPELIGAYLDGELDPTQQDAVARHLADCVDCAALAAEFRQTSVLVAGLGREPAPANLSTRLTNTLRRDREAAHDERQPLVPAAAAVRHGLQRLAGSEMMRRAAVLLLACILSSVSTWWLVSERHGSALLAQDALSAHLRSLLQDSPIQVASSDSHTVKPWFAGKVEVSPEVRDLTAEGFPLVGGRLDSIGGRRVATLVYRKGQHLVSIFAWAASNADASHARLAASYGYNIETRLRGGMIYVAVSDIDSTELNALLGLLLQKSTE